MIARRLISNEFLIHRNFKPNVVQQRHVQISVIGAASEIGSNLSMLLKSNCKIQKLNLYDDDENVQGFGIELCHIPGGPIITIFNGHYGLAPCVRSSNLVVMVSRVARKPSYTREQMISANAPAVQRVCKAIADQNPEVLLAISTNPINSIIPFASTLLCQYRCYNPYKLFGITHIDTARSRVFAGNALKVNPKDLCVPVIGGHSEETVLPLFSNLSPTRYCVDTSQADMLTRLVRKAGIDVVNYKHGFGSATLAMAWSINEFINIMVDAILGNEQIVHSFTANHHFGTRFFAGPTLVGAKGIIETCCEFPMSEYERYLLNALAPMINKDVSLGEKYVRYMECAGKH